MQTFQSKPNTYFKLAVAVAVLFHIILALTVYVRNPSYMSDFSLQINPDAAHYMVLSENLFEGRGFSRQEAHPYAPDALRTPVYPVLAGVIWKLTHTMWAIYFFQAVCFFVTGLLLRSLALHFMSPGAATFASAAFSLDLMLITLNFESMTESVYNLIATSGTVLFLTAILPKDGVWRLGRFFWAGIAIGLAALTRPTGLYLPVVFCMGALVSHWVLNWAGKPNRGFGLLVKGLTVFCLTFSVVAGSWMLRNLSTFGIFRISTVDAMNMVYYVGAGPYQLRYGVDRLSAQDSIQIRYGLASNIEYHNPWLLPRSVAQLDAELRAVSRQVVLENPGLLAIATVTGVAKAAFAHTASSVEEMSGAVWKSAGFSTLIQGNLSGFAIGLSKNHPVATGVFFLQMAQSLLVWSLFAIGLVKMTLNIRQGGAETLLLLLCAYYALTMGMGGMDATARFRSVILPIAYVIAAFGFTYFQIILFNKTNKKNSKNIESQQSIDTLS